MCEATRLMQRGCRRLHGLGLPTIAASSRIFSGGLTVIQGRQRGRDAALDKHTFSAELP